jgi:hypothetical protein
MKRCPQCWQKRPDGSFINRAGYIVQRCAACREKYRNWAKMTPAERLAATNSRAGLDPDSPLRVRFVGKSRNAKTGPIPVTLTSAGTCPPSCGFFGKGCYAEQHLTGHHWRETSRGEGLTWDEFCARVSELPEGQVWRHNEAGDLPGTGEHIDTLKLFQLVTANLGRRGFTYTHKPVFSHHNQSAIHEANRNGFTVNLSADSLEQADDYKMLGIAPVVVTLPSDAPAHQKTPLGHHVIVCPADGEAVTCASCELCANAKRKVIVGFLVHGNVKEILTERMKKQRQLPLFGSGA